MVAVSYKLSFIYFKELTEESTCGVVSSVCFKFLDLFVLLSLEWCYRVISWFKGFLWRKFSYGIWLYMCDLQGVKINSCMESITRDCNALDHMISFPSYLVLPYIWFLIRTDFLGTWEYKLLCCYRYFSCNISISVSNFFYPNFRGSGLWSLSLWDLFWPVWIYRLGAEGFTDIYVTMSSYEHSRSWDSCSPMSPHEILKSKQRFRIDEVGVLYCN